MLELLINKTLMVLFFLSCLTTIRHLYYFIQAYLTSTDETTIKYFLNNKSLLFLGVSIAYILSVVFTGIKL